MSLTDLNIDAETLVVVQTGLAFITSPFTAPTYNFPLFLFGLYATAKTESNEPLRLLSGMVGLSILFDLIWLVKNDYAGLVGFVVVVNMLIKFPTFLSVLIALRHRGYRFSGPLGNRAEEALGGAAGNTVWSMPGGFSTGTKPGYQNIDDDLEEGPTAPPAPARSQAPPPGPSAVSHQAQSVA